MINQIKIQGVDIYSQNIIYNVYAFQSYLFIVDVLKSVIFNFKNVTYKKLKETEGG